MRSWPLQEARNHLRDVIDNALDEGHQRITRHGKRAVVVVYEHEWHLRASTTHLLADSPLTTEFRPPRRVASAIRRDLLG